MVDDLTLLVTSVVSGKQPLRIEVGGGEVGQLWYRYSRYRLRVPRSQRHIPTQTILKYPHPHGIILPLQPVGVQGTPLAVTD